ncbi:hypothetical protein ACFQMA_19020 [Halosimplex aquaticum]|uniref:Uncharacterized protein n=1 Tax=Halosimplex aquaticum TaxID=3026162 RepID=A0ABD5Y3I3_9EURY|nr:hypothetical protein [Halosimplex aquaticum]
MRQPSDLLDYEATNAAIGWLIVVVLCAVGVERAFAGAEQWVGVVAVTVVAALVPPVVARDPKEMVAWEVLAVAAVPVAAPSVGVAPDRAAYAVVAALALVVAVELDAFTDVEMTPDFAVGFVVVLTMAVAGLWVVVRYGYDAAFGTHLLGEQNAVMWELILATAIGVVAGAVFEAYVRRVSPGHGIDRTPWRDLR